MNIYYYGLKANPLTLAHEQIILKNYHQLYSNKNDDVKFIVGYVDTIESDIKNSIVKQQLLHFKETNNLTNLEIIKQYRYLGLYQWIMNKTTLVNRHDSFHIIVGDDEYNEIQKGLWIDSDKIKEHWIIHVESRSDLISSTKLREIFYRDPEVDYYYVKNLISKSNFELIKRNCWYWQEPYSHDADENNFIEKYDSSIFPKPSVTVDNVVIHIDNNDNGEVLLIRRGAEPYKGYWAFPGGFFDIEKDDSLEAAAARELIEETNLSISSIDKTIQFKTYGNRGVDPRMRIVDVVYVRFVNEKIECNGEDDAIDAHWFKLNELPKMAFNHKQILDEILVKSKANSMIKL